MPITATKHPRYPYHLAKVVARRLLQQGSNVPIESLLLRLFETLYFASLKTDEARPCRCTINFVDPDAISETHIDGHASGWTIIPLSEVIPFDVRNLLKISDAVDPNVSSLAVHVNGEGNLVIWGLVDQELRYGDHVALDAIDDPIRPGLFQATIAGVGCVSVYKDYALLGSLEQHNLVVEYHDVLWEGPIHKRLKDNMRQGLGGQPKQPDRAARQPRNGRHEPVVASRFGSEAISQIQDELFVRWQNSICRILFNIQQYGHGGGLLIVPSYPASDLSVKYEQTYDRLPKALVRLAQHQMLKRHSASAVAQVCQNPEDLLPCELHFETLQYQSELDRLKNELLGCVRYIASLSRVDGFVVMDQRLVVHGFGVEIRTDAELSEIFIAGDAEGSSELLRPAPLKQFGTRHRAMMRYCDRHRRAMGFVVSQDGDIRAIASHRNRLVMWENVNVQLAYRAENRGSVGSNLSPMSMNGLLQSWMLSISPLRSA